MMSFSAAPIVPATRRQPEPLLLASKSPRRAELLRQAGYRFEAVAPPLHEPRLPSPHLAPAATAEALAYFKARSVAESRPEATVLGADTLVVLADHVLGKPRDAAEARRCLELLSGQLHFVVTGVAIVAPRDAQRLISCDFTQCRMRPLINEQIEAYVASQGWQDKAGGYALQEPGDPLVEILSGSRSNVVGLPLELLERLWKLWYADLGAAATP